MKQHRARRHPAKAESNSNLLTAKPQWRDWKVMLPLIMVIIGFLYWGVQHNWDVRMLAGVTLLIGLLSGALVWLVGLIGLVPIIGPIIVKVLSFGFIWLLNALGYIISYVAIRRGYSKDVLTYRGLTIALMIGIVIGYVIAQFI